MDTVLRILLLSLTFLATGNALAIDAVRAGQACLDWRRIGVLAEHVASCSVLQPNGWQTRRLFDAEGMELPRSLTRYCRFEDLHGGAAPAALQALVNNGQLLAVERDCVAGTALGDPAALSTIQWNALAAQLLEQAGAAALAAEPLLGSGGVRLAVVDGNPTDAVDPEIEPNTSPHGNALITMAETLLCTSAAPCPVRVTSQLALTFLRVNPLQRNVADRDEVNGGHLASIAEFAVAVHREVAAWRLANRGDRLILSASLGWNGEFGGNEAQVTAMPPAVQAAYAALFEASCHGALIFAAAGNRFGGIDAEVGPMLPAAWEQREAPTQAECAARLGPATPLNPANFGGSNYRPLLRAVSGIEADGNVLDNARQGANARFVAFGDHAAVESMARAGGEPTATLTGSSVATLLASVNAAVAWSWQPSASAHQIGDILYNASNGTTSALLRSADFCLGDATSGACRGGASANAHRLSLCLTRLAMGNTLLTSAACAWNPGNPALALDYSAFDSKATRIGLSELDRTAIIASCNNSILRYSSARGLPAIPCPHITLPSVGSRPWVLPQPGSDLCPQCEDGGHFVAKNAVSAKVLSPRVLRIQITPRLVGTITDVVLIHGQSLYRLDIGRALLPGERLIVDGMETLTGDRDSMMIAFAVDGRIAALSTILVAL